MQSLSPSAKSGVVWKSSHGSVLPTTQGMSGSFGLHVGFAGSFPGPGVPLAVSVLLLLQAMESALTLNANRTWDLNRDIAGTSLGCVEFGRRAGQARNV